MARHVLVTRPIEEVCTVVGTIPAAFAAVRMRGQSMPVMPCRPSWSSPAATTLRSQACEMLFNPFDPDALQVAIGSAASLGQAG